MPDKEDKHPDGLTEEEQERAIAWLDAHNAGVCARCGNKNLNLSPTLGAIPTANTQGNMTVSTYFPCVVTVCPKCAHMQMYSAMEMGLMQGKEGHHEQ